ncbi:MAG: hypothetical protein Q8K89_02475 [Actinomycetota bacterium]|nr:hypothetical protein [Actinomycetota bacterium]
MTATVFPAASDTFFNVTGNPRMNDATAGGKSTEIITHLQNGLRATQDELRSSLAARWEQVDMWTTAVAASTPLTASSAINSGTITTAPDAADHVAAHPGIVRVRSGGLASAGFRFAAGVSLIGAQGLSYRTVFAPKTSVAGSTLYVGHHNGGASTAEPATGCYLQMAPGGVATFKAATNGARTSAPTTITLAAGVWYTVDISWVTNTSARCVIRNDAGTVLLNQTVVTNVPNSSSFLVVPAWSGFNSSANTDIALVDLLAWGAARPAHCAFPS